MFIRQLNQRAGGVQYRLPTEAEWEYASRAGASGRPFSPFSNRDAAAWHSGNSGDSPHPVGQKRPNAWGLHDMLGNVWEWVQNWYGRYPGGTTTDPLGPSSGSKRVGRGGGWSDPAEQCRVSFRSHASPGFRSDFLGFRLLRTDP